MAQSGYTPIALYHSITPGATPAAGNLVDGELALNIADGNLFYKRSGVVTNLAGLSGFSGDSGFSGRSGFSGFSGTNGTNGTSGFSGISGFSGFSGISGFSGVSGSNGASGFSGFSGFSGAQGPTIYPGSGIPLSTGSAWGTSYASVSGAIVGTTDSQTLTNKRINPRVSTTTSSASAVTPDIASFDQYCWTAQAATLTINAPSGTPVDGNKLVFRILDNGTTQAISWNATYTAIGVTLPTTTTPNKTTYVGCIYNTNNTRWDVIAVTTQA